MARFTTLAVKEIKKETDETVSISFKMPIEAEDNFQFKAGQYLTLKKIINGEDVRRSYSLCSSPEENEWRVAVKKVPNGKFSTFANEILKVGDSLEAMPPAGNFIFKNEIESESTYVFFAAGSGITPVISLIKNLLAKESTTRAILFYGNKNSEQVIFKDELEGLKNRYLNRFSLHYILSQERQESTLFNGRIDGEKCTAFAQYYFNKNKVAQYFICGPEQMIHSVKDALIDLKVPAERIKFELFNTGNSKNKASTKVDTETKLDPATTSAVTVKIDGDAIDFPLSYHGKNVLDAAIAAGADAPFACKGGVCCTCKAKLIEGKVEMDTNYGLEPDEINAGYILTCQSHPRTPQIKVDFDS